jgi:ADP-heptose:LPS heptosyltransferase
LLDRTIDKRNLGVIGTAKEIATCGSFIGLNSGLMHIANATPVKEIWIHTTEDYERPVEKNYDMYPHSTWLYNDNSWFSDTTFKNTSTIEEMLQSIERLNDKT